MTGLNPKFKGFASKYKRKKEYWLAWKYMSTFYIKMSKSYVKKAESIFVGEGIVIGLSPNNEGPADVIVAYESEYNIKNFKKTLSKNGYTIKGRTIKR